MARRIPVDEENSRAHIGAMKITIDSTGRARKVDGIKVVAIQRIEQNGYRTLFQYTLADGRKVMAWRRNDGR